MCRHCWCRLMNRETIWCFKLETTRKRRQCDLAHVLLLVYCQYHTTYTQWVLLPVSYDLCTVTATASFIQLVHINCYCQYHTTCTHCCCRYHIDCTHWLLVPVSRPVYPYAFGILLMIVNIRLRQHVISTLIMILSCWWCSMFLLPTHGDRHFQIWQKIF